MGLTRVGLFSAAAAAVALALGTAWLRRRRALGGTPAPPPGTAFEQLMRQGTPMVELASLSALTGCRILAKCEFLLPGGCSKDRMVLRAVRDAVRAGAAVSGHTTLCEGTSGSTGVSLAHVAAMLGFRCAVSMPDDASSEKVALLAALGASVERVPPAAFVSDRHYVAAAQRTRARFVDEAQGDASAAVFLDQFETESNWRVHEEDTGPEIWRQAAGAAASECMCASARAGAACRIDAFVMGAGTGGTLAGVAAYLKRRCPRVGVFLVDPPGSSLLNLVRFGVAYAPQQSERGLRRRRDDTVIEGVGLDRVTGTIARALPLLDGAESCSDGEAVAMSRFLLRNEGLFLGPSSALNVVGAIKVARRLGRGHTVVTMLCDSGHRYLQRFWSADALSKRNIDVKASLAESGLSFLL